MRTLDGDQGPLDIKMGMTVEGKFVIDFGKDLSWIGMSVEQAVEFANLILEQCESHNAIQ